MPEIKIPEGLDGLVRITVDSSGVSFSSKPFYQEIHMEAEGISVPFPGGAGKSWALNMETGMLTEKSHLMYLVRALMLDY